MTGQHELLWKPEVKSSGRIVREVSRSSFHKNKFIWRFISSRYDVTV